jgi:hypothetical protein
MKTTRNAMILILLFLAQAASAGAGEKAEGAGKIPVPLKIDVVFARYQGERKESSIPYTFRVNTDERPLLNAVNNGTRLRMGIQVPVAVKEKGDVQYNNVGTDIDCSAQEVGQGRFRINLGIEQSSIYADGDAQGVPSLASKTPLFRQFRSQESLLLRDGEMEQYAMATDPVSGEVLKVTVKLTVIR